MLIVLFFYISYMENFVIEATKHSPLVSGNCGTGEILISGRSIPENATNFYRPFLVWIDEYKRNPHPKTHLTFYLDYLNSISQKVVYDILESLNDISNNNELIVFWKYDEDDEEILDEGKVFQSRFELDFRLIPVTA